MITACIFVVCSWSWSSPLCFENKRRRSVLEANLHRRPPARSPEDSPRPTPRTVRRRPRYTAELPCASNIGDGGRGWLLTLRWSLSLASHSQPVADEARFNPRLIP